MYSILQKLHKIAHQLGQLQKEYSSIEKRLNQFRGRLHEIQDAFPTDLFNQSLITEERELIQVIEKWEAMNKKVLRQRSRATWINHGDKNFKYFFSYLKARQARNRISSIYNEQGLKLVDPIPVTEEDVQQALKNLPLDKSLGIDGFNAQFLKTHWDIIGKEVTDGIMQFFSTGKLLKGVNITTVTLIRKVSAPSPMKEYRHIVGSSTLYKIISKILTAKLKKVVDYIVSPS
ncbi:uncharacterized protein LOC132044854 [Lycium ferocissimum]|uniref:uncharacterized protein LOC132044854 n=1 Tax=Lycium ferocissimum TaxID=112874 RepID=UPI0028152F8F|nr:uncharacterized protein LOC132044854 [Lycium ferocissimum]